MAGSVWPGTTVAVPATSVTPGAGKVVAVHTTGTVAVPPFSPRAVTVAGIDASPPAQALARPGTVEVKTSTVTFAVALTFLPRASVAVPFTSTVPGFLHRDAGGTVQVTGR